MRWGWWPRGLSVPFPSVGLHVERECFRPLPGLVHRLGHQPSAQHGTSRACPSPCSGLSVNKCRGHIHAHGLVCIILILVLIWIILVLTAMLYNLLIRDPQALKLSSLFHSNSQKPVFLSFVNWNQSLLLPDAFFLIESWLCSLQHWYGILL